MGLAELVELEDLESAVDNRTLELIEHRRRSGGVRKRGWLVRRALLTADLFGLCIAFAITEFLFAPGSAGDRLDPWAETAFFFMSLPVWVVVAKLYNLYDRDEERADHSTADDVVGVLNLITIGTWLLYAAAHLSGIFHPSVGKMLTFWCLAFLIVAGCRGLARSICR